MRSHLKLAGDRLTTNNYLDMLPHGWLFSVAILGGISTIHPMSLSSFPPQLQFTLYQPVTSFQKPTHLGFHKFSAQGSKFRHRKARFQAPVRLKSGPNGSMVLDSPEFHACFTPELERLAGIFKKHGYELRIAGGAVR